MVRLIGGAGLLAAIAISGWCYASAEERSGGLFVSEDAALKYTSSFGQGWDAPVSTESAGDVFKLKMKVFDFQLGERRGYALLGSPFSRHRKALLRCARNAHPSTIASEPL